MKTKFVKASNKEMAKKKAPGNYNVAKVVKKATKTSKGTYMLGKKKC